MLVKHAVARAFVRSLPTDVGLWRLMHFLPDVPDRTGVAITKLRGYPLVFKFKLGSYMGWYLFYRGVYEEGHLRMCVRMLRDGMNFVDVGANCGLYSIVAAKHIGPNGRIVALEPQSDLAALVAENAALNCLTNVAVKPYALGSTSGNALLYQPQRCNDGAATLRLRNDEQYFGNPVDIAVETLPRVLDACDLSSVGGMKLDVEGAELAVLTGASDLLGKSPPEFILLECIDEYLRRFDATSEQLFTFLWDFGYRTACLYRGRWRSVKVPADHLRWRCSSDVIAVQPATPAWDTLTTVCKAF